jgi:hypothetical protein
MHPADNVAFAYHNSPGHNSLSIHPTDPTRGTAWSFVHFYAAACTTTPTTGNTPTVNSVVCGPNRPTFTCHARGTARIAGTSSVNQSEHYAQRLDTTGFAAVVTFKGSIVTQVKYSWHETSRGLQITQDVVFGFEDVSAAALNPFALKMLLARATHGDLGLALAQIILHEVEIVGFYQQWLPAVYQRMSAAPGTVSAAGKKSTTGDN